ncbi:MAG: TolC family protein [Planctomycetota bacterium]|nr:TolC family protein [Planctomycetota bacterium]
MKRMRIVLRTARLCALTATALSLWMCAGCFLAPPADAEADRIGRIDTEIDVVMDSAEAPVGGLTLEAAIDYALCHNLSIRAAEFEYAIVADAKTGAALRMLPSLQANLGVRVRNKYDASTSERLRDGTRYLEPSFSSEKVGYPTDLTMVWSILDFGLSNLRARRAAERECISGQTLRRLRQRIAMDVTIAYYRLLAAGEIMRERASIEEAVRVQLAVFEDEASKRNLSETERACRSLPLLSGLNVLRNLAREREDALTSLARAMGAPRGQSICAIENRDWSAELPPIPAPGDVPALYERALAARPEMFKADSDERISALEAKAALLQIAPAVNLTADFAHDAGKFLVYHTWMEAGVRLSWDLLRLPAKFSDVKNARQRAELVDLRRKLTAASVLVQVNLALVELNEIAERMELLDDIESNRRAILRGLEEAMASGKSYGADALDERLRHISDYANRCLVRAEYMAAVARLVSALGIDPHIEPGSTGDIFKNGLAPAVLTEEIVQEECLHVAGAETDIPAAPGGVPDAGPGGARLADAGSADEATVAAFDELREGEIGPLPELASLEEFSAWERSASDDYALLTGQQDSPWQSGAADGGAIEDASEDDLTPVLLSGVYGYGAAMKRGSGENPGSPWSREVVLPVPRADEIPRAEVVLPTEGDMRGETGEGIMTMAPGVDPEKREINTVSIPDMKVRPESMAREYDAFSDDIYSMLGPAEILSYKASIESALRSAPTDGKREAPTIGVRDAAEPANKIEDDAAAAFRAEKEAQPVLGDASGTRTGILGRKLYRRR